MREREKESVYVKEKEKREEKNNTHYLKFIQVKIYYDLYYSQSELR